MAKNRYSENGHRGFVRGLIKNMEAVNEKLYRVEIWALNDEVNRNGWKYINLEQHLKQFENIPILTAYVRNGQVVGDSHNYEMKRDPRTGEKYASFTGPDAERTVGWVPENSNIRIEKDGETSWIVVTGYLWTWYNRELVEKIARQGSGMSVSIETLVTKEHKQGNVDVEEEYIVLGITVLGDGVQPAVAGANIQTLAALRSSMEGNILKAAAYINPKTNEENKGVKKSMHNERRLKELSKLEAFANYTVVGVSDDDAVIALLSANGAPCIYARSESDAGNIIAERIRACSTELRFKNGDDSITFDLEDVLSKLNSTIDGLKADKTALEADKTALEGKVSDMVQKENARRVSAAKAAIEDELKSCNANTAEGKSYSADIVKELSARAEKGEFTALEDKDGNWIGEKSVRMEVKALCMDAQKKMNEAEKANEKRFVTFQHKDNSTGGQAATLGELAASGSY